MIQAHYQALQISVSCSHTIPRDRASEFILNQCILGNVYLRSNVSRNAMATLEPTPLGTHAQMHLIHYLFSS